LTYVIGEMIAELNCSHSYVGGGDMPRPKRILTGLLGARLERDKTGFYKVARILKGSNWDKELRSPLAELGINVSPGDYIVAIDGKPTSKMSNIYEALINTVGKQVKLKVNTKPAEEGGREIIVLPIADEQPLYYYEWVQGNIKKVSGATNGQVGYIHVPDMLTHGLNEFVKHFYPQLRKRALIMDVRGNRGTLPFLDGGSLNKPEFASYDLDGKKWVIEGRGIEPDIVVDNDPATEYAGVDQQLNRAIEVILEDLLNNPRTLPAPPAYPK